MPDRVGDGDGRALADAKQIEPIEPAASTTLSRSSTKASKLSGAFQSERPLPRSSYRQTERIAVSALIQWLHSGLARSASRWLSQLAALTKGGPSPVTE